MILVVGGIASGKHAYVESLGFDASRVTFGLEEQLRKGPLSEEELESLSCQQVVTCLEVGLGVVPMDAHERAWRELVGRTCARLATRAEKVVRMVCGIPVVMADVHRKDPQ